MILRIALLILVAPLALAADAPDKDKLSALLADFLSRAGEKAAHERFWADELVYTSSSGLRFGKADILGGMEDNPEPPPDGAPVTVFSGEEVDIRQYGDMAVVAFKLVGRTPGDSGEEVTEYFNTGTFLKRDGEWRVVAWQATRIPDEE